MVVDCLSKAASQQPVAIKEAEEQLRSWEQQVLKLLVVLEFYVLIFSRVSTPLFSTSLSTTTWT